MRSTPRDIALAFEAVNKEGRLRADVEIALRFSTPSRVDVLVSRVKKATIFHDPIEGAPPWVVGVRIGREMVPWRFETIDDLMRGQWWADINGTIAPKLSWPVVHPDHRRRLDFK